MNPYRQVTEDIANEHPSLEWTLRRGNLLRCLCAFGHHWQCRGTRSEIEHDRSALRRVTVVGKLWECDTCGAEKTWRWYSKMPPGEPARYQVFEYDPSPRTSLWLLLLVCALIVAATWRSTRG